MNSKTLCNDEVFGSVFLNYSPKLYKFLCIKHKDLPDKEDFISEAFRKLWERCAKVSIEKAESFAFAIIQNDIIDYWRREKNVIRKHRKQLPNPQSLVTVDDIQTKLEKDTDIEELRMFIAKLPEKQKIALILRLEGLPYRKIAEYEEVTVRAIENRISKAIKNLRRLYRDRDKDM